MVGRLDLDQRPLGPELYTAANGVLQSTPHLNNLGQVAADESRNHWHTLDSSK